MIKPLFPTIPGLLLVLLVCTGQPAAGAELGDGNLRLVLRGAVGEAENPRGDIELDIPRRDGAWGEACFGRLHHRLVEGTVSAAERTATGWRFGIELEVLANPYIGGGSATCTVAVVPGPEGWRGEYTGHVRMEWPPEQAARDVAGTVVGHLGPVWPEAVADHVPPAPGEHPRLVCRSGFVPELRRRATETEVGRAILERILATCERPAWDGAADKHDKFTTWPAAGHAIAWLATGEERHAAAAARVVRETLLENPAGPNGRGISQDIHHAPRVLGLALAYDLCHAAWEPAFRDRCAREIARRVRYLLTEKMRGMSMAPEANHNAIRVSCAGLGALAVLGDEVGGEPVLPEAATIARRCAREVRSLLEGGFGSSGSFDEGHFYKIMTAERGLVHFLHAHRLVMGARIDAGPLGDHFLVGDLLKADPGEALPSPRAYDGGQGTEEDPRCVMFAVGLTTVPPRYLPAAKWVLERSVGLAGDRSFGINHGLNAAYPLITWPFAVESVPPGEVLPWMLPDPRKGHYLFRPRYRDAEDPLAVVNLKLDQGPGWDRGGWVAGLEVWGLGSRWLAGSTLPVVDDRARNGRHGGELLAERRPAERVCALEVDQSAAYLMRVNRKHASPEEKEAGLDEAQLAEKWLERLGAEKVVRHPARGGKIYLDFGIEARRSMLVDCSGLAGAPLVVAFADRVLRGGEAVATTLELPIVHHDGELTVTGNRFRLGASDGPALHGLVLGGEDLQVDGETDERKHEQQVDGAKRRELERRHRLTIRGSGPRMVVLLPAATGPTFAVDGTGPTAAVTVGDRVLRYDGERIGIE